MRMVTLVIVSVLMAASVCPAQAAPPRAATTPQVKIDRVDAADPSDWRILVSALDADGMPAKVPETGVDVFMSEGKGPVQRSGAQPIARFGADGLAAKGFGGILKEVAKDLSPQAVSVVAVLHAEVPREAADVLPAAIAEVLNGLRADAQVSVFAVNDAILAASSSAGEAASFSDVNDFQDCLGELRSTAGGRLPAGGPTSCGRLFGAPAALQDLVKSGLPAPQGLFPRFLGLDESGEVLARAESRGHFRIDRSEESFVHERYAAGAIEAALRLLITGSAPSALRSLVIFSDGRDGYLRVADAAGDRVAARCRDEARVCTASSSGKNSLNGGFQPDSENASKPCSRAVLECSVPKVAEALARREQVARDRLVELVLLARSAGVRISTVALPGTDEVGNARLESLAIRTGGTFRSAPASNRLKASGAAVAAELSRQAVVRPGVSLQAGREYGLVVTAGDLKSATFRFTAGTGGIAGSSAWVRARGFAIGRLGHRWGPPAFWVVSFLAGLAVLGIGYARGKGIWALVKKVGKAKRPKGPAVPGVQVPSGPGV
jgi:hypothetical protein